MESCLTTVKFKHTTGFSGTFCMPTSFLENVCKILSDLSALKNILSAEKLSGKMLMRLHWVKPLALFTAAIKIQ